MSPSATATSLRLSSTLHAGATPPTAFTRCQGSADEKGREQGRQVFVRKGGRTGPANEADIERLFDRAEIVRVEPILNAGLSGDWIGVRAVTRLIH